LNEGLSQDKEKTENLEIQRVFNERESVIVINIKLIKFIKDDTISKNNMGAASKFLSETSRKFSRVSFSKIKQRQSIEKKIYFERNYFEKIQNGQNTNLKTHKRAVFVATSPLK